MIEQTTQSAFQPRRIETLPTHGEHSVATTMKEENLPFTVRLVRNQQDLHKAVSIRHSAYARHLPEFAQSLKAPETADAEDGVVVLLAESKLDGSALGTMRIQTNQFKPLSLEQSVELPQWLRSRPLAEATRLGVAGDRGGRLVTTMIFKAFYQYCRQSGIEWMVVTGRAPVDRMYDRLLFKDVYPGMGYIPFIHVGNLPHRVMSLEVSSVEPGWAAVKHPLYDFFFHTHHPDLDLGEQQPSYVLPDTGSTFNSYTSAFPM